MPVWNQPTGGRRDRPRAVVGPAVSTAHGTSEVRVGQPGFPAVLTAAWDAEVGYAWQQLVTFGVTLVDPTYPQIGENAFCVDGNEGLAVGTQVWVERAPDDSTKYLITATSCDGWGADYQTAGQPFPNNPALVPDDGNVVTFTNASTPAVYQVVPYTLIEIPASVTDCVVEGNLSVVVVPSGTFASDWANFYSLANVYVLDDDCLPIADLRAYSFPGGNSDYLVSGQTILLNSSPYLTGNVGLGGASWWGDRYAYFRVNVTLLRAVLALYSVTSVRLAWAFTSPTVSGFPATWSLEYSFNARPSTSLHYRPLCAAADPVTDCSGSGSGPECCDITGDIDFTFPADVAGTGGATSATFTQVSANAWTWAAAGGSFKFWTLTCAAGQYTLSNYLGATADNEAEVDCEAFALEFDATLFGGTGTITAELAP